MQAWIEQMRSFSANGEMTLGLGWSRKIRFAVLAPLLALGVAACAGGAARTGKAELTAAPSIQSGAFDPSYGVEVDPTGAANVALLAPVSDRRTPIRNLARSLANAAQLAMTDIRDPGLRLTVYDTKGTPEGAEAAAARAAQDGAALLIGPLFANSVRASKDVAAASNLTMIPFSTDASVAGDNVFLIGFMPQTQIKRMISYAVNAGVYNFGALAPRSRLGDLTMGALRAEITGAHARLVAEQRYTQDFQGIEQGVSEYAATHAAQSEFQAIQAIYLGDQGQALQSLAAYLAYFDVSPQEVKFIGGSGWSSPSTLKEVALRGGWFAGPDPRLTEQFADRYESAYGDAPHPLASLGYDAIAAAGAMIAEARARRDSYPFTIQAITAPAGFAGVNGVFRFLPNGLNERGLAVLEVREGGFSVIDPAPSSFAGY